MFRFRFWFLTGKTAAQVSTSENDAGEIEGPPGERAPTIQQQGTDSTPRETPSQQEGTEQHPSLDGIECTLCKKSLHKRGMGLHMFYHRKLQRAQSSSGKKQKIHQETEDHPAEAPRGKRARKTFHLFLYYCWKTPRRENNMYSPKTFDIIPPEIQVKAIKLLEKAAD